MVQTTIALGLQEFR